MRWWLRILSCYPWSCWAFQANEKLPHVWLSGGWGRGRGYYKYQFIKQPVYLTVLIDIGEQSYPLLLGGRKGGAKEAQGPGLTLCGLSVWVPGIL